MTASEAMERVEAALDEYAGEVEDHVEQCHHGDGGVHCLADEKRAEVFKAITALVAAVREEERERAARRTT